MSSIERFGHLIAAALAASGGVVVVGSRPTLTGTKPVKKCRNKACWREHQTGKPCCSAECFKAWKAGVA